MPITFIWPVMLVFLLLIPLFVLLYLRMQQRRRQLVTQAGSLGFLRSGTGNNLGARRHLPPLFFLLALAILIIAFARPQMTVSLPRIEGTVILAFDVSGSMAAADMKPTRIDAAKAAAKDFIERQPPSVQIGVVAFSDSGLSVQAPTNDQGAALAAINRLTAQRGTSLANGIFASLTAIALGSNPPTNYYSSLTPTPAPSPTPVPKGTYTSAVIVLLTDGENNENPDPLTAAQAAADQGVRIYTVGLGSAAGTTLHVNGFNVFTQLDENMLQQISETTGASYYNAEDEEQLFDIYDHLTPQLVIKPQEMEVTSILAGVGIVMMLIGGTISLLWLGRLP